MKDQELISELSAFAIIISKTKKNKMYLCVQTPKLSQIEPKNMEGNPLSKLLKEFQNVGDKFFVLNCHPESVAFLHLVESKSTFGLMK